jgi:hypothetical protein
MSVNVTFNSAESCSAFATRFNLTATAGDTDITIPWHLLPHAKKDSNATEFEQVDTASHQFIVAGDATALSAQGTIDKDLGGGFFLVSSTNGLALADLTTTFDINSQAMQFLENVGTIQGMNVDESNIDPASSAGQWARIRVASQYRPLMTEFSLHNVTYKSTPELYIMDTGINFSHPEFAKDNLTTEDFYTLPAFNGSFADDVGHGTAVAAMAVGKNLGIASHCKLINVKIGATGRSASLLEVGDAIDAIITRAMANPNVTRVVNMSWGVARSSWLDHKVQSMIDAGMVVVCAAGNSGISVEDISPAGLDTCITVGSIDKYDIPSGFNNISPGDSGLTNSSGLSLDLFAPGEDVLVASNSAVGGYALSSGTSFATPLVAGVAVEIAALNSDPLFYSELKKIILDTATEHALLFEDDTFSENQNRIIHIITSDSNSAYAVDGVSSYLGVHTGTSEDDKIIADLNSTLDTDSFLVLFPDDSFTYSVEFDDPETATNYGPFIHVNPVTGVLMIDNPTVPLSEEEKLRMVSFKGVAISSRVTMKTNELFFFATNPAYSDTMSTDITLALTETNSISFYATWNVPIK